MPETLEEGLGAALRLLRVLEGAGLYEPLWWGPDGKELWTDEDAFRDAARQQVSDEFHIENHFQLSVGSGTYEPNKVSQTYMDFSWSNAKQRKMLDFLTIDINRPHHRLGTDFALFESILDVVLDWRQPVHMSWVWSHYRMELQPIDTARRPVGWIGWVPFQIAPADLPEAEIVKPKGHGTFVASQRAFWFSKGDQADPHAIERAQAMDMALNRLGVLPTTHELRTGTWPPR